MPARRSISGSLGLRSCTDESGTDGSGTDGSGTDGSGTDPKARSNHSGSPARPTRPMGGRVYHNGPVPDG
ncbi:hypothetical protein KNE206_46860 [Kitasatospora sp. NE20-6]